MLKVDLDVNGHLRRPETLKAFADILAAKAVSPVQLRERRLRLGLTQAELGRLMGLSTQAINERENGHRAITKVDLLALQTIENYMARR